MTVDELIRFLCDISDEHGPQTQVMVTGHDGRRQHEPVPCETITLHRPMMPISMFPLGYEVSAQALPMQLILEP